MTQKFSDAKAEQLLFDQEVEELENWWKSPRQAHIKRPYSAKSIAALRNIGFKQQYASSIQGLKLWDILHAHRRNGTYEFTLGTTDPLVAAQMAKHQQTVYVSGALCGLSQVSWPGEDHADYPWDTVPGVVKKVFNSQLFHDQRQNQLRMRYKEEDRDGLECTDYLLPIVADGDMGFGSVTSCMKLTKTFVESGVAMIHVDDLAIGLKKFTNGEGRTIVPTSEYLQRLTTVRMQFDIMGVDTMLLCRCDSDHAEFITSVLDPRDHEYVLGATKDVLPFAEALEVAKAMGQDYLVAKQEWKESAGLKTFDELVKENTSGKEFDLYKAAVSEKIHSLAARKTLAKRIVGKDLNFDWELPRTPLGQYMFQWSTKVVIERAILAAPLGDVSWSRQDKPNKHDMHEFHDGMRKVFPDRLFAFGYTGAYDFIKAGYSEAEVESFPQDIAKLGNVWQVQPIWATQGLSLHANQFAKMLKEEGIAGYIRNVAKPATAGMHTDKFGKPTARGGYLADSFFDVVRGLEITDKASS